MSSSSFPAFRPPLASSDYNVYSHYYYNARKDAEQIPVLAWACGASSRRVDRDRRHHPIGGAGRDHPAAARLSSGDPTAKGGGAREDDQDAKAEHHANVELQRGPAQVRALDHDVA